MAGRIVLGVLFIVAGILHFRVPGMYMKIVPPMFPSPLWIVWVSGAAEILGGIGVMVPMTRRAAAWGLVALLIAVWPANLYMAMIPERFPGMAPWMLWARLPLQVPLIWWAWRYTRR